VVVAEDVERLNPPVEQGPVGGELGDVLPADGVVVPHFGGAEDVVGGCAGPFPGLLGDRSVFEEFELAAGEPLAVLAGAATGGGDLPADRGGEEGL
jgi:hypothetical protein